MVLQEERYRALATFVSCCVPFCIEILVGGVMHSPMPWQCMVIAWLYTSLAFKATVAKRYFPVEFTAYGACCHASLYVLTAYTWLSFFNQLYTSTISCMLPSTEYVGGGMLIECQRGGLVRDCEKSINFLNKITVAQARCPTQMLGYSLGNTYMVLVYLFRFIPCGIFSMWNLYTWNENRFDSTEYMSPSEVKVTSRDMPKLKPLMFSVCIVILCCILEITGSHIHPLSSFEVVLPYVFGLSLYYALATKRMNETSKDFIFITKNMVFITGIVYTVADFVMNSTGILYRCIGNDAIENELKHTCKDVGDASAISKCYNMISRLDDTYFHREACPALNTSTFVMYTSNIVKVIVLAIAVPCMYAAKNKRG